MSFLEEIPYVMSDLYFLLFCLALIAATAAFKHLLARRLEQSDKQPEMLPPSNPNPYALAFLRGGDKAVIRLAVFDLIRQDFLHVEAGTIKRVVRRPRARGARHLDQLLHSIYKCVKEDKTINTEALFLDSKLKETLQPHLQVHRDYLLAEQLVFHPLTEEKAYRAKVLFIALLTALITWKIGLCMVQGKDPIFYFPLILLSHPLASKALTLQHQTKRGKRFLKHLQYTFGQQEVNLDKASDAQLLQVGTFGLAALHKSKYAYLNESFGLSTNHKDPAATPTQGSGSSDSEHGKSQ